MMKSDGMMFGHKSQTAGLPPIIVRVGSALLLIQAGGCAPPVSVEPHELTAPERVVELKGRYEREYVLGPFDQIEVVVRGDEEASREVEIGADGMISLPIAGTVEAAGLTVRELTERLTERYRDRLVEPEVTVIPLKVREPQVYVLGQVAKPGAISFRQATTALEAIANAGDMLATAETQSVALIRLEEDGVIRIRLIKPQEYSQPSPYVALSGLELEPEDILFVPERPMAQTARFLDEFAQPFIAVSAALQPWVNLKVIQSLDGNQ